jgi:MFS family permease
VIAVALAVLQQITGVNTVLYYGALIFREQVGEQSRTAAIGVNVIVGATNFLATIIAIWIIDKVGRKPLLLTSAGGMGVSLVMLGLTFQQTPPPATLILVILATCSASRSVGPAFGC